MPEWRYVRFVSPQYSRSAAPDVKREAFNTSLWKLRQVRTPNSPYIQTMRRNYSMRSRYIMLWRTCKEIAFRGSRVPDTPLADYLPLQQMLSVGPWRMRKA